MSVIYCHELGLPYDLTIQLNMQSANGTCNLLLGLACNVPFLINTLTFYLQVHIIQLPPYDVLLGCPINILTESIVYNFANEDQTITICDPNTSCTLTILTILQLGKSITKVYVPKRPDFLVAGESSDQLCNINRIIWLCSPHLLPSIPQSDSLKCPLSLFSYSSTSIPPSLSDSFPISFPITIPSFYLNSDQTLTSSNSCPQFQETSTNTITNQFISLPRQLFLATDDVLLPICLTLIPQSIPNYHSTDHIDFLSPIPVYISAKKKYKPVHLKIKPVISNLLDKFRIIRNIIGNLLKHLPTPPTNPSQFTPTGCYTKERKENFDKAIPGFLWPSEQHLMHYFMMIHNDEFAWDSSKWGHFQEDFFPPVNIWVVPHKPWVQRNILIPPGLYEELCKVVKQKLDTRVFKPSNSSY